MLLYACPPKLLVLSEQGKNLGSKSLEHSKSAVHVWNEGETTS